MHLCFLKHLRMGTARMKETEEGKQKSEYGNKQIWAR